MGLTVYYVSVGFFQGLFLGGLTFAGAYQNFMVFTIVFCFQYLFFGELSVPGDSPFKSLFLITSNNWLTASFTLM